MKVPNAAAASSFPAVSLSRLQNEGSQLGPGDDVGGVKSIKATE